MDNTVNTVQLVKKLQFFLWKYYGEKASLNGNGGDDGSSGGGGEGEGGDD